MKKLILKYDPNGIKKKNFIQLMLEAETNNIDMKEDGFVQYAEKSLNKRLTLNVCLLLFRCNSFLILTEDLIKEIKMNMILFMLAGYKFYISVNF